MNPFFGAQREWQDVPVPARAYARLDNLHLPHADAPDRQAALRFDLIDADWLDDQAGADNPLFDLGRPHRMRAAWKRWFAAARDGDADDPFRAAPLYVLEVSVPFDAREWRKRLGLTREAMANDAHGEILAAFRRRWYELTVLREADARAGAMLGLLHRGIADEGLRVCCFAALAPATHAAGLTALGTLAGSPALTSASLKPLVRDVRATYLGVYDVGQANANALLGGIRGRDLHGAVRHGVFPTLYFDLGMPLQSQRHTAPTNVRFCFTAEPPIVLSHWHDDHLGGVALPTAAGCPTPQQMDWIVPDYSLSTRHKALVTAIWAAGGSVHVFSASPAGRRLQAATASGHLLTLTRGTARDPNNGGIVMQVSSAQQQARRFADPPRSWLLPGDCDYKHFPSTFTPTNVIALVAPHHGADLGKGSVPVPPAAGGYLRLVYSFGRDNKYQHPRQGFVDAHHAAGWTHPVVPATGAITCVSGDDVRTTNVHSPWSAKPRGVLVGWSKAPHSVSACTLGGGATNCTLPLAKV